MLGKKICSPYTMWIITHQNSGNNFTTDNLCIFNSVNDMLCLKCCFEFFLVDEVLGILRPFYCLHKHNHCFEICRLFTINGWLVLFKGTCNWKVHVEIVKINFWILNAHISLQCKWIVLWYNSLATFILSIPRNLHQTK